MMVGYDRLIKESQAVQDEHSQPADRPDFADLTACPQRFDDHQVAKQQDPFQGMDEQRTRDATLDDFTMMPTS